MKYFLDGAWILVKILSYGGLVIALVGVAKFGWHFVRLNARAGRGDGGEIPRESWRGEGAKFGIRILAVGVLMQLASFVFSSLLPGRL